MMGWVGTIALAAHGVALQIASLTFMMHLGLSQAITVRAGRAWGQGTIARLLKVVKPGSDDLSLIAAGGYNGAFPDHSRCSDRSVR